MAKKATPATEPEPLVQVEVQGFKLVVNADAEKWRIAAKGIMDAIVEGAGTLKRL